MKGKVHTHARASERSKKTSIALFKLALITKYLKKISKSCYLFIFFVVVCIARGFVLVVIDCEFWIFSSLFRNFILHLLASSINIIWIFFPVNFVVVFLHSRQNKFGGFIFWMGVFFGPFFSTYSWCCFIIISIKFQAELFRQIMDLFSSNSKKKSFWNGKIVSFWSILPISTI